MKRGFLILTIVLLTIPLATWKYYKHVRIMAPELVNEVSCVTSNICLEDESKYSVANELYDSAYEFVKNRVGEFKNKPRVIFCSTQACVKIFGLKSTGFSMGRWGIIMGPRGWVDYKLRHEMIHHRQAEELGILSPLGDPKWFVEGMAYSFSNDPRQPLSEPWQQYRSTFEAWNGKIGNINFWEAASKL